MNNPLCPSNFRSGILGRLGLRSRILILTAGLAAISCTDIHEWEARDGNGAVRATSQFIGKAGQEAIMHGAQISWYPDGKKEAMDIYVHGYRQGYAYRWYPGGKLKSVEHYTDGIRDGQAKYWDDSGAPVSCAQSDGSDCPVAAPDESSLASRSRRE